jgi:hypothetical protein
MNKVGREIRNDGCKNQAIVGQSVARDCAKTHGRAKRDSRKKAEARLSRAFIDEV